MKWFGFSGCFINRFNFIQQRLGIGIELVPARLDRRAFELRQILIPRIGRQSKRRLLERFGPHRRRSLRGDRWGHRLINVFLLKTLAPLIFGTWLGLIVMATIASLIPANRGAQMPVVDALRHV